MKKDDKIKRRYFISYACYSSGSETSFGSCILEMDYFSYKGVILFIRKENKLNDDVNVQIKFFKELEPYEFYGDSNEVEQWN